MSGDGPWEGKGSGYGKLILFGEHFVVYKVPALVAAVNAATACSVKITKGAGAFSVQDDRPAIEGYKVEKKAEQDEATAIVLRHLKVSEGDGYKCDITFGGDLTCTSGIGASAASCVALSRAVNDAMGFGLDDEGINRSGYEGEKGYHGTPSGIDNTASTYGGLLLFQRTDADPTFSTVRTASGTCRIVFASTGITASTTKVVGDVRALKESDPALFDSLMGSYSELLKAGVEAAEKGDWESVGKRMDENHALLQRLTVSCPELDTLVDAARAAGAVGAKMSGTGRGGLIIALTPGKETQEKVENALRGLAKYVWTAEIGKAEE